MISNANTTTTTTIHQPTHPTQVPTQASSNEMSVFDMNTRAVVCLKEGRALEGMEGLRDTLVHTRTLLLGQQQQQQQQQQQRPPNAASMQCDVPPLSLFTVPLYTPPADNDAAHCPLFDRAFVVGGDNDDSDSWMVDTHCQNVTLGVLLYNLALSHHLTGLHKGATASQEYQVAMNLYQMALSLVETSIRQPNTEECQNLVLLLCAIFNNMANIHSRHFHVEETRNCLECLKEIVSNNTATTTTEEDQFFFYLNLFVTAPVHDFAIAPAA